MAYVRNGHLYSDHLDPTYRLLGKTSNGMLLLSASDPACLTPERARYLLEVATSVKRQRPQQEGLFVEFSHQGFWPAGRADRHWTWPAETLPG